MDSFLDAAVQEATEGLAEGGIPIGCVVVHDGKVIGRGRNRRVQNNSAILHGEMDALENSGRLPAKVYQNSTLYTTSSPCSMCSGAIALYGIPHVVIGENNTFMGEETWLRSKGVKVTVVDDYRCQKLCVVSLKHDLMCGMKTLGCHVWTVSRMPDRQKVSYTRPRWKGL